MELGSLWRRLAVLPERVQQEVADLIAKLEKQHSDSPGKPQAVSLREEPFVGLWKDRDDLSDSTAWVRRLREQEWRP